MTGMLIKDFKLLKGQKNFYLVFFLFAAFMVFTDMSPSFLVNYETMIFSMFTLSTVSYDEYDNGLSFLFTLPVTRKQYAAEKYLFGLLLGVTVWCATVFMCISATLIKGGEFLVRDWLEMAAVFPVVIFFQAVMLPLQLKFGAEKGRVVSLAGIGILFFLGFFLLKGQKNIGGSLSLLSLNDAGIAVILCFASIGVVFLSFLLSAVIMERKQL